MRWSSHTVSEFICLPIDISAQITILTMFIEITSAWLTGNGGDLCFLPPKSDSIQKQVGDGVQGDAYLQYIFPWATIGHKSKEKCLLTIHAGACYMKTWDFFSQDESRIMLHGKLELPFTKKNLNHIVVVSIVEEYVKGFSGQTYVMSLETHQANN